MLGPLLFVYNKFVTVKKEYKKGVFHTKKLFTERKFEKCCEAKKMHKGHITGRRKNFN